jgi:predicted permease
MAWYRRLRNMFRRDRVQRDIDRELSFHLAERAEELQADGMSEEEAVRHARRQFGNLALHVERTRDVDVAGWLDIIVRDFRYSARTLARAPVFTVAVVLTLALGIGANSAVFSAIHAVLLRPLPFPDGDQLIELHQSSPTSPELSVAPVRLEEWNRMNSTFQAITGYYTNDISELSGELPENLKQALVAPRFLQVWGISPVVGRDFSIDEEQFGGPKAVLISDRYWRRRFRADPTALGKQLRLGASSFQIVGIMPASFLFPDRDVDLWSPSPMDAPYAQSRASTWFTAIGRLKRGLTVAQAQADLAAVQANLGRAYPKTDAAIRVIIQPLKDAMVSGASRSLWILFGSVSVLLLIACTNIATMLLSRATQRQHEIALLFSLGASRASVVARFVTESFLLALAGAALGLVLAAGASNVFRALTANLPRIEEIGLDWRIVLYSLACAVVTTFLCGLYPAIRCTRGNLSATLVQASRAQVSGRSPVHLVLVGVQMSLAVALLIGAGLLVRSFRELARVAPGFDPSHVLTFRMTATWGETGDMKALRHRTERILGHLRSIPGIEAAAMAMRLPGVPTEYQRELKVAGGRAETEPKIIAESRYVSSGYFGTMQVPLIAGEFCRDDPSSAEVVVNRAFANTYFSGTNVIGRRLKQMDQPDTVEIRGIVGDARELGINRPPVPTVYWCYSAAQPHAVFLVRTHSEPMMMAETVRRKIREIEPRRSLFDISPLEERISDAFAENRLRTFLLAFFAATAVALACLGLYGTLSYVVSARRREIGLRLALGALPGQIVTRFLMQGLGVSFIACVTGLGLGAAFTRLLSGMLFGVSPSDTITQASVVLIVMSVAMIASLLPAIRAARLDPIEALRDE